MYAINLNEYTDLKENELIYRPAKYLINYWHQNNNLKKEFEKLNIDLNNGVRLFKLYEMVDNLKQPKIKILDFLVIINDIMKCAKRFNDLEMKKGVN